MVRFEGVYICVCVGGGRGIFVCMYVHSFMKNEEIDGWMDGCGWVLGIGD